MHSGPLGAGLDTPELPFFTIFSKGTYMLTN